ncbi:MAG: PhzF family phenazine biosynthesis protein [Oscillospiraceae bacterium]|nr:PhzF family phenazine biosynthesis protein [Oscillospiraceae bacterium]
MRYYVVDAFTDELFKGNPAGVCLLDEWPDNSLMQSIAAENNLAETAFIVKRDNHYELKWFTPEIEIDLCGHATLASAYVISNFVDRGAKFMRFESKSGLLTVEKKRDLYELDFPSRIPVPAQVTLLMKQAIGMPVLEAYVSRDLLLLVESEEQVRNMIPGFEIMLQITGAGCLGIIVTARGTGADFVSRFFAPGAGIPEDPVTGSAHATLIPYWSQRIGKNKMTAMQLSKRGGTLWCKDCGDRVKIAGKAVLYLQGEIRTE